MVDKLKELLKGAIDGSIQYGNPVSDFVPQIHLSKSENQEPVDETTSIDAEEETYSEYGFLDYIANIQDQASKMTKELNCMTAEMLELNSSVDFATQEINRVKSKSGTTSASFVRGVCRKLALPTDKFAKQVKVHTLEIAKCWKSIENDYLSLIDNKFAVSEGNIQGMRESVTELRGMQDSIIGSNEKIESFVTVLQNTIGIERKLNQAVSSLITELQTYLSETEIMYSSIDRIISKSDIVIGKV